MLEGNNLKLKEQVNLDIFLHLLVVPHSGRFSGTMNFTGVTQSTEAVGGAGAGS